MTEQPSGSAWPGGAGRGGYRSAGQPSYGAAQAGYPGDPADPGVYGAPRQQAAASSKGFISALFDFGFTSFVTPKVVKVLYALIVIVVGLSALGFAIVMLATNVLFGLIILVIGAPLYFLVVTALYRITLEFFMVIFRMAEDIRALRERGEYR